MTGHHNERPSGLEKNNRRKKRGKEEGRREGGKEERKERLNLFSLPNDGKFLYPKAPNV